eukprot:TRINITY_DN26911_c0_g1_i1.p1 TRINITY_DN26911_c0_g1~~TRINITY_DN26911_c0_g1_i1.p1  ORF type:complete len:133 (+),score=22.86 TRINITY_DN26911_c0_g1_i1:68-466(+)
MRGTIHDPMCGQSRDTIAAKQAIPLQKFEQQRNAGFQERRAARDAEGGRGGGFNERQEKDVERKTSTQTDDSGFDDFGRRISNKEAATSKAARASAALERLKQKGKPQKSEDTGREGGRTRSRSRSGRRSRC